MPKYFFLFFNDLPADWCSELHNPSNLSVFRLCYVRLFLKRKLKIEMSKLIFRFFFLSEI